MTAVAVVHVGLVGGAGVVAACITEVGVASDQREQDVGAAHDCQREVGERKDGD